MQADLSERPARAAPAGEVPRQLPAAVACFTGRAAELRALTGMLGQAVPGGSGTVVISAIRPRFPLPALAGELADSAGRLDAVDAGDLASNVRAVFPWSYRQLTGDVARMFGLLGIHPGPGFAGFRRAGQIRECLADVPEPAADPGGGQPAGRAGPLPGQPQVGGQVAGEV